jgi:hypothetical protein
MKSIHLLISQEWRRRIGGVLGISIFEITIGNWYAVLLVLLMAVIFWPLEIWAAGYQLRHGSPTLQSGDDH